MSQSRARARRKERRELNAGRALLPPELNDRLSTLRRERDKELRKLTTQFEDELKKLLGGHAGERAKIWKDYDDRRNTMLRSKKKRAAAA